MHLGVHHTGQHVQPLGVEHLGGLGAAQRTDGGNAPADDPHIRKGNAIGGGHGAVPDQQIETFSHRTRQLAQPPALGNRARAP